MQEVRGFGGAFPCTDARPGNTDKKVKGGKEAREVKEVGAHGAPTCQQQAGNCRSGHHRERAAHRGERGHGGHLLWAREFLRQCLQRRPVESTRPLQHRNQQINPRHAGRVHQRIGKQTCQTERHQRFRADQQALAVKAIGCHPSQQRTDHHRDELHQCQRPHLSVGAGQRIELPGHGDVAHHAAEARNELAGEKPA